MRKTIGTGKVKRDLIIKWTTDDFNEIKNMNKRKRINLLKTDIDDDDGEEVQEVSNSLTESNL